MTVDEKLALNKIALVRARRANDDELAKRLSQERQKLKRQRAARCGVCGVVVNRGRDKCRLCCDRLRFYKKVLA